MNAVAPIPAPEVSPTVLDALRASPVAPVLDMPLPPAPELPTFAPPTAPGPDTINELLQSIPIPTLPEIDELLRPIAELGNMFGTGICGALDPSVILEQGAGLLDGAAALGRSALSALPESWEGTAADTTAEHSTRAQFASYELSERGNLIGQVTRAATATVERGNIELTGIAQSFIASAVATAPVAMTPPGQAALLASAVEHVSSALAVVARTRGELTGHTVAMNALTPPIPVPAPAMTSMPLDPSGFATSASGAIPKIGEIFPSPAGEPASTLPTSAGTTGATATLATSVTSGAGAAGLGTGSAGAAYSSAAGSYGAASSGATAIPAAGAPVAAAPTSAGAGAAGNASTAARGPAFGGAPLGAAHRAEDTEHHRTRGILVTSGTTSEVVGELPFVTPAVIGAVDDQW
ncbi:hypothetical protein MWU77_15900 [Rhodococcus sp. F64268]|uniref:hypothetical protein n=1 Tax=unclassified Rhodococcus (in: high G+C Gram-positive bacteria) TaxID=192944 RepID=UPI001FF19484|nr:hypothetical protein [Rhodococcus sp. F64268]MCK0092264.1 hypothetical protein [Rhodococcus sp. F64268]